MSPKDKELYIKYREYKKENYCNHFFREVPVKESPRDLFSEIPKEYDLELDTFKIG